MSWVAMWLPLRERDVRRCGGDMSCWGCASTGIVRVYFGHVHISGPSEYAGCTTFLGAFAKHKGLTLG